MATREKKLSVGRKQNTSSPLPPKDDVNSGESQTNNETSEETQALVRNPASRTTSLAKRLATKNTSKKLTKKKPIVMKLKPATIKKNAKIKQKIIKALTAETKKKLLNPPRVKQIKSKRKVKSDKSEESLPPVLEPILPIEEDLDKKQQKKKPGKPPKIDNYAKKVAGSDGETKRVYKKRVKTESAETIEDVMNDLSSLIKSGETKEELEDSSRQKATAKKKKTIESTLSKLSPSQRKVIDMLDLNVKKFKGVPLPRRRHSIEKFPVGHHDAEPSGRTRPSIFNNLPRCISPRSKSFPKLRQPVDGFKRSNPYKTRSDSPARILRNGKQRKLKDLGLLEGLDVAHKRRKRNCSDFSGSELSASKLSGCESDSSFSDMSSLHEHPEAKDVDAVKVEERSPSAEADGRVDTNSNLCDKENDTGNVPHVKEETADGAALAPSLKVPEKSLILDIMKRTFNDSFDDKDKAVAPPVFFGMGGEEGSSRERDKECDSDQELKNAIDNIVNGEVDEGADEGAGEDGPKIEETPEDLAIKEKILRSLGLQSLQAAKEAMLKTKEKSEPRNDLYTGTLKTVIKLNRGEKKKGRVSMKMTLHKKKAVDSDTNGIEDIYKTNKEAPPMGWKFGGGQSSDTAGAHRKSHYSNRSNPDGSSDHTSDGETQEGGATRILVIPEKASSFSIHPGRVCKDECSYCYGKFGLFDTPCHLAQMKSVDRQNKILAAEKHLTRDSCLCDACYRHVDRKANTPSYTNRSYKRNALVAPGPRQDHCHVLGCHKVATNILRRKWIIKMRRSICEVINIDLDNPGLHSIPICDEHYSALEYLMVCAMCKRRLAKNHVHYLGPETVDLNVAMKVEGIPLTLTDKPVVCKLCKFFAAIILKSTDDRPENSSTFFNEYKKRLLHFNDIVPMDEAAAEEPIIIPAKETKLEPPKKKRKLSKTHQLPPGDGVSEPPQLDVEKSDQSRVPSSDSTTHSRPESPSDYMVDYNTLIPSIAMDCGSSDSESKKDTANSGKPAQPKKPAPPRLETVKQAVEISKNMKLKSDKSSDIAVQRLGSNPSISVRQLFPCEEELPLQGHLDFGNVKERTPEGWEKCSSIVQYDAETKLLWQELQKPYGNQSSFLRHLILLEKYFRNGDLILAPNASHHSIGYSESVHNRLRAYDNIPAGAGNPQPLSMIPFNRGARSHPKSTPITISQLNSPPLIPPPKPKPAGAPPGLISLQPGTNRPAAPLVKAAAAAAAAAAAPQSQKIKFPITKNWRPNLIPIDPTRKAPERRAGLVQVISGGRPYHITLEDYKKMCAIKKSFELKQRRLQEAARKREEGATERPEARLTENKPPPALPKIPKSLTVIPQTVARRPSRPSSPVLLITAKPKQIANKS